MKRIAVLLTCHNRRQLTERCIFALKKAITIYNYDVYLVDDGCTDGTTEMIKKNYKEVNILQGSGNLFWNRGMYLAFKEAVKVNYDFYLWLNDDLELNEYSIDKMIGLFNEKKENSIVVGYTTDKLGKVTYGGIRKIKSLLPLKMSIINPDIYPIRCDTMHGNCVLISNAVVDKIGIIDPYYRHGFGDADYGLRATNLGCEIWLTNFPVGICEYNYSYSKLYSEEMSLIQRFKYNNFITRRPVMDWLYFTKKFAGPFWIFRFLSPYIHIIIHHFTHKFKCSRNGR